MFKPTNNEIVWQHVKIARTNLFNYISSLDAWQWDQPSLCQGWRVRDVVAHMTILYKYPAKTAAIDLARSGFKLNGFLYKTAIQQGQQDYQRLLKNYQEMIGHKNIPFFVPAFNALVDTLVHEQDIRIPLDHQKQIPAEVLQIIFKHWEPKRYNIGEKITGIKKRTKGLKFITTDMDLTFGQGLVVTGSAQDILLILTGRKPALNNLHGEGVNILRQRMH